MPSLTPCLWFDADAEDAAAFYVDVFGERSQIVQVSRYPEDAPRKAGLVMTVEIELDGQRLTLLNGGPQFTFSEAVSLQIGCADQAEVDRFWERLTDGGQESQCGWCKDRFGFSWQVIPAGMDELFGDPDPERARRAMRAMMTMGKLDVAALRAAADGVPTA